MHPATHRALRELIAAARLLTTRWSRLAEHCPDAAPVLSRGAETADAVAASIAKLAEARDVAVGSAASGVGTVVGQSMARMGEPFLERNQALRSAALHAHHTTMTLHYVERLARAQDDGELADACRDAAHRLVADEGALREIAIAEGDDPDRAIQPVDDSPAGRAAHQVAVQVGALGEWMDRRMG